MNREDIQKLRIDVISNDESALSILMDREGRISRQGNGILPSDGFEVMSENDGSIFSALLDSLDDKVFEHAGLYDHPNKVGQPITYSVAFLKEGEEVQTSAFEFRLGTETKDVGELLPYFDQFISKAVMATDQWYQREKDEAAKERDEESS